MLLQDVKIEGIVADVLIVHRHSIRRCTIQDVNDGTRSDLSCRFVVEVMSAGEAAAETSDRGAENRHRTVLCDERRTRFDIINRAICIFEGIHEDYDGILVDAFELMCQLVGIEHRGIDILEAIVREIGLELLHLLEVTETGVGFIIDGDDRIRLRKKLRRDLDRALQVEILRFTGDIMIVHRATCAVEIIDAHKDHRAALKEGIAIAETKLQCCIIGEDDGVERILIPILVEQTGVDILQIPFRRVVSGIHELLGHVDPRVLVEHLQHTLLLIRHGDEVPAVGAQEEHLRTRKRSLLHGGSRRIRRIGRVVEVLDEHHEATEDKAGREGTQDDMDMFS